MPDSDESRREAVEQEAADELDGGYGDLFFSVFLSIFDLEGHRGVFKSCDAAVGNGDPVGIARQVFENVFRLLDGIPYVDNPVLFIQAAFEPVILMLGELDMTKLMGLAHLVHELAAEDQRQRFLIKKIVPLARCPA